MTTVTMETNLFNTEVKAKLICTESLFVNNLSLVSFEQLQNVLGGNDCYVIKLPEDILLWTSVTDGFDDYKHTVTIHNRGISEYIYGNVIITSNDEDNISGMKDLTDKQLDWLKENFCLEESIKHRGYAFTFYLNK